MNFLKKKLKPLTSGLTASSSSQNKHQNQDQDLESDLYDDYVVEAPPHPSELLALGVDPTDIDVNDPEKLKELYRKVKEEGRDKKVNSVLLAKQREKEQIEVKKKTTEEWKFFDSLTARVEEAVKNSQKTLVQLKESSAIEKLNELEYEFRPTPEELAKLNKKSTNKQQPEEEEPKQKPVTTANIIQLDSFDFGSAPVAEGLIASSDPDHHRGPEEEEQHIVEELFEDLGIDLRPSDQRNRSPSPIPRNKNDQLGADQASGQQKAARKSTPEPEEEDPFDTSFVETALEKPALIEETLASKLEAKFENVDPFDTSFVNL